MAKGSSSRGSADGTPSSLTSLLSPIQTYQPSVTLTDPVIRNQLYHGNYYEPSPAEDRRLYRPDKRTAPPHAFVRSATRLYYNQVAKPVADVSPSLRFNIPSQVAICVRRKIRREVLHALDRKPKRGKGGSKRHRNFWSQIKC